MSISNELVNELKNTMSEYRKIVSVLTKDLTADGKIGQRKRKYAEDVLKRAFFGSLVDSAAVTRLLNENTGGSQLHQQQAIHNTQHGAGVLYYESK